MIFQAFFFFRELFCSRITENATFSKLELPALPAFNYPRANYPQPYYPLRAGLRVIDHPTPDANLQSHDIFLTRSKLRKYYNLHLFCLTFSPLFCIFQMSTNTLRNFTREIRENFILIKKFSRAEKKIPAK